MNVLLVLGSLWVLVIAGLSFLPVRRQFLPVAVLFIPAPALIFLIGVEFGWIAGVAALVAFVSMFRHPLRYFWRKARGLPVEVPE